jgi:uncharacterized protein (DUF58 family)
MIKTWFKQRKQAEHAQGVRVDLDELLSLRLHARHLDFNKQRKVMTLLAGGHHSGFRGRGFDFAETRHYQPGDDIRALDWRVTARYGIPHTKVFQEERERPVLLVTDYSLSMRFGTRAVFKSVQAARLTALLAWTAAAQGERVGGLIFSGNKHHEIRPAGGRKGVSRLLRYLVDMQDQLDAQSHGINYALEHVRRVARPGSLICLASDFHGLDNSGEDTLKRLAQHTNVLAFYIYDPLEAQLPPPGFYAVSDGEKSLALNTADQQLRARYQAHFQQHYQRLDKLFTRRGLRLLSIATDEALPDVLQRSVGGSGKQDAAPSSAA